MDKHNVVMPSWVARWLANALALLVISFIPFRGGRLSLPERDLALVIFAVGANLVVLLIADWVLAGGFGFPSRLLGLALSAVLLAAAGGITNLVFGGSEKR
ncbi:MAG: hypothetical protein BWY85_02021 [Firmicutes bacterium ADurb.Bin506]|nr:MAG: hypothetical protein BWY85_02021 [Firmicutes bacterium ADurb.Bin506]